MNQGNITDLERDAIVRWFGKKFEDEAERVKSYGALESIISAIPTRDSTSTAVGLKMLVKEFQSLSDQEFAFLITHSGFIPDHYGDDSSDETLYSKLIEATVAEWGSRIGFQMALPTTKSSTEDVTFFNQNEVAVCDAKSFRLGRSQGAPNTKDAIKQGDYAKWLGRHDGKTKVGGLVAFPSKFDWQRGSDVYLYTSNGLAGQRIMMLFYEHMGYILLKKATLLAGSFFEILKNYDKHFKLPSKDRHAYWLAMDEAVEGIAQSKDLKDFLAAANVVVAECVRKTVERIEKRIGDVEVTERTRIEAMDDALLLEALVASEVARKTEDDRRRLINIRKFR